MATKKTTARRRTPSPLPWIVAAVVGVGLALALTIGRRPAQGSSSHPEPRSDAANLGESVMPASFFSQDPRIVRTYQLAREIPATLDGLYCNCHCKENAGHRSLLTCFQSDHGAGCDVCLGEADLAAEMHAQGKSLQEIRAQIDVAFSR